VEVGLTKSPAEAAKIIIAEVNDQMPRTLGDSFIHVSRLSHIVPVSYPIPEMPMAADGTDPIVERLAGYVADLIPDGATMQMGIGAIPDAVLKYLFHKKDLGVHSELISDGVIDLVEAGVLTSARKTLHPGKIVLGFVLGSQRLYSWVNDNPLCEFRRTEYVNDPFIIAQNDNMVAINSAIEIDLTGQVCADSIGPKFFSGIGGQLDFVYGASRSKGGIPIIAMPSTNVLKDGTTQSKIVSMLKQGAGVVTGRNHVHYVVTEYGVADLYGKSIRQRVKALVGVSHPDFRADLEKQANALNWT
jgi:acetyl-CoA hydrolase